MKQFFVYCGIVVAICVFAIGAYTIWSIGKRMNYSLQYEDMVQQTVRDMVKAECLKK